ncbi:MAG: formylglycine-generating enzyme family protein [bacterium]
MKASLFYTVIAAITFGAAYNIWDYKHSHIPVSDLEAMKSVPAPDGYSQIKPFSIDKYEVTNGKFWRYNNKHKYRKGTEDFPVVGVNWYEAFAYAKWAGKRLPTVAEWQHAKTARKNEFTPWDAIEPKPLEIEPGEPRLFRVGKFWRDRTPFGMVDMSGNAWEWTADTLRLPDGTLAAIIKGGFIVQNKELLYCKTTTSDTILVDERRPNVGFRCVRDK